MANTVAERPGAGERLLSRIRILYTAGDGVLGRRRIHEDLCEEGETAGVNRIGRLMKSDGLRGIP
ncbi:MAG: IS3 family transposase [Woeseia sp.]